MPSARRNRRRYSVTDAVRRQALAERLAALRIVETAGIERANVGFGRFGAVAENQLQVGIGRERLAGGGADQADVDAFVDRIEQSRERVGAGVDAGGQSDTRNV